jgi:hypothetical protein
LNHKIKQGQQGTDVLLSRPNGSAYCVTLDDRRDVGWWIRHLSKKNWVTPAMLGEVAEAGVAAGFTMPTFDPNDCAYTDGEEGGVVDLLALLSREGEGVGE